MDYYKMRFNLVFATALLVSLFSLSGAQMVDSQLTIGSEICSCAPNTYEFILDFALTCPPVNITLGDTVAATTCMVSPFGDPAVSDLVPVSVSSIDVLELNQNLQVMVQENIEPKEVFLDGDTFSYVSYAAIPGEIVNPEDLPRAIQLNLIGVNKNGEEIINVYLITFTNACGAYPVLQEGQFAGWTRFSDMGPPTNELCPAAPSAPPTPSPTMMPIVMSMSMSMDMNIRSSALGEDFSIQDYLEESMDVQEVELPVSSSKGDKAGKSSKGMKTEKNGKSKKSDLETKKENKESKKDTNKLKKSEKSEKSSTKRRLRIV